MPDTSTTNKSIKRGVFRVGTFTGLSRLLGFCRDILAAQVFGAGAIWDAFVMAFTLPNTFRRILGEGAFASAFIPAFLSRRTDAGDQGGLDYAGAILGKLTWLLAILCVIGWGVCALSIKVLGPNHEFALALRYGFLMMPYLLLVCLTAGLGALLNALKSFALPALSSCILNVIWISAIVVVGGYTGIAMGLEVGGYVLCAAILLAGLLQLFAHVCSLRKIGFRFRFRGGGGANGDVRALGRTMAPAFVGLAAVQGNVVLDQLIASTLVEKAGAVSILYYANRLMQFPLALIGIAIATVIFPFFADATASKNREQLQSHVSFGMQWIIGLAWPACLVGLCFAEPIVRLILARGAFGEDEVARTVSSMLAYVSGLVFYCFVQLFTRVYHAHGNMISPAKIAGGMVAVNIALNLTLVQFYDEVGLAIATAICAVISAGILSWGMNRQYGIRLILSPGHVGWSLFCALFWIGAARLLTSKLLMIPLLMQYQLLILPIIVGLALLCHWWCFKKICHRFAA